MVPFCVIVHYVFVIAPWRAPDLGRVGGDVGDLGPLSARAGKTPSSSGMPRSRAETWIQARAAPGPERLATSASDSEPLATFPLPARSSVRARSPMVTVVTASIRDENRK